MKEFSSKYIKEIYSFVLNFLLSYFSIMGLFNFSFLVNILIVFSSYIIVNYNFNMIISIFN